MTSPALPDANVLYSRTLRDWLFLLSSGGDLYTVHTTLDILTEVLGNYRKQYPHAPSRVLESIDRLIRENVHSMISGYEVKDSPIEDIHDHHVHWAATEGRMMYLVTSDRGFLNLPEEITETFHYEIMSPDAFFCQVDDSHHEAVRKVAMDQVTYWSRQSELGRQTKQLHVALHDANCPHFAARIEKCLSQELRIPVNGNQSTTIIAPHP